MLHIITGRTGYGKTEYALNLVKETVKTENNPVSVIVPEQASFFYERRILEMLGAKDAQSAETLSFSRIAENILTHTERGKKPLVDDGGRIVLMSLALESLNEKLKVYKRYIKSVSVANELLKLSSEFKRCMITPLDLYKVSGAMDSCFLKEKLSEIALITETYDALLSQSFSDDTDNLTLLAKELETNRYFKDRTVIIDSFNGFTAQEYAVIERIMIQAKDVCICLCTDVIIAEKDFDPSVFAYVRNTAQKLIKLAKKHSVAVASPIKPESKISRFKNEELTYLEKVMCDIEKAPFVKQASALTFLKAPDLYAECACVAANVKRLLREEGYRCRDIAVLFRNAEKYEKAVKSALIKCDIPVFEDKRQPIASQPLTVFLMTVCEIAANGFSCENVMRLLKTGLTDISAEEAAELENYALLWRINGERWTRDFTSSTKGYGSELTEEEIEKVSVINEIRKRAISPLMKLRRDLQSATGRDISEALYKYLIDTGTDERLKAMAIELENNGEKVLALEQERVWNALMETLDMLALTLKDKPMRIGRYYELFSAVISTETLGNIPHSLDEVTVGGIDRTVTSSPRAVFVVGVNEGEFPKKTENTGMLNDSDRKLLREMGMELYDFGETKSLEERFFVYKTLCSASEKLFVSYAEASVDGTQLSASSVVSSLLEKFKQCKKVDFSKVNEIEKVEGLLPAFELFCLENGEKNGIYNELKEWFEGDERFSAKMKALSRITNAEDFEITDKQTAKELFGENMYLSASRVEKFYNCPFSYFCAYGLLARPRLRSDFDAAAQGTEIHFILETLLKRYGKDGLVSMSESDRQTEVNILLEEFLLSKMGNEEKSERFMYLYNRLQKSIGEILSRLVLEFSHSSFVPVDFELKIDKDGAILPYKTELDDGSTVSLKGVVDRVDMMELNGKKYIRIVDYKSGKKEFKLSEVFDGLNMQMLLYLFSIWENGNAYYGDNIVPSGFLYMPARSEYVKPERAEDDDSIALKKAKSLRMSGMILDEEMVILGMDDTVSGCFVPVERKDALFKSDSLISLYQLSKLKKRVDRSIQEMSKSLRDGKISAIPSVNGDKSACDFCDYRSVCSHENGDKEKTLFSMANKKCLELLEGEEE